MKTISTSLVAGFLSISCFAQIHSSGINLINGNNVGIGTANPGDRLEISSSFNPNGPTCISCPPPNTPGIRFSTSMMASTSPSTYYWDIDAAQSLEFKTKINNGNFTDILKMTIDQTRIFTNEAIVTPDFVVQSSPSISGANAMLSIGVRKDLNSGQWFSTSSTANGVAFITNNAGGLEIKTGISNQNQTDNALVISSSGNIGIGTANPNAKLMVSDGNLKINSGDLLVDAGRFVVGDGNDHQFEVNEDGYVIAREILVDINQAIPDYVFEESYALMPLNELRDYIAYNKHLPNIPSAKEFETKGGIELGELSRLLLEKQEEMLLYILQLEERLNRFENHLID